MPQLFSTLLTTTAIALASVITTMAPAMAESGSIMNNQIRMMFERFDRNGDGVICEEEFKDVHMIRFYTLDMDNDGRISREEYVFVKGMRGIPSHRANARFTQLDTDGNGYLSVREFNASRAEAFAALDLNGDGVLSPSEVSRVVTAKTEGRSDLAAGSRF